MQLVEESGQAAAKPQMLIEMLCGAAWAYETNGPTQQPIATCSRVSPPRFLRPCSGAGTQGNRGGRGESCTAICFHLTATSIPRLLAWTSSWTSAAQRWQGVLGTWSQHSLYMTRLCGRFIGAMAHHIALQQQGGVDAHPGWCDNTLNPCQQIHKSDW